MSRAAVRFGNKHNIPVIVDVRDLWPEIYFEVISPRLHFLLKPYVWYCKRVLKNTMSKVDSIVGLSPDFLRYGLKYAGREQNEKDAVIPIGYPNYDYSPYKNNKKLLEEKFGLTAQDFIVAFLGNFGNQFDFNPIVEAANKLREEKNIKFVLCGTGVQLEDIKKQVCDNVIFPGWIEKEEIMSLTANASIGLAPYVDSMNYRMNTPNKFGKYLSAALPPVISVGGLMEGLLQKNNCGAKYSNSEELKNIILSYYKDPIKLKDQSKNARRLYDDSFNADIVNEKFVKHLEKIIEG